MDKRRPENRNSYAGRFGNSADVGSRRPTGSYRSQPAGSYRSRVGYEERRRPGAYSGGDSYTRRPAPEPARQSPPPRKSKKKGQGWKRALAVVAALAIVALLLVLLLSGGDEVVHQLPNIEPI